MPAPPGIPGYGHGALAASSSGKATGALVCGIVGLLFCGIVLGPVAIGLGFSARSEIRRSNGLMKGDGLALAGIVLGFAAIGLFVLIISLGGLA